MGPGLTLDPAVIARARKEANFFKNSNAEQYIFDGPNGKLVKIHFYRGRLEQIEVKDYDDRSRAKDVYTYTDLDGNGVFETLSYDKDAKSRTQIYHNDNKDNSHPYRRSRSLFDGLGGN